MINITLTYSMLINIYKFLSVLLSLSPRSSVLPLHAYSHGGIHGYLSPAHVGYMHTYPLLGVQVYLVTRIWSGRCGYSSFICTWAAPHNPLIPHASKGAPHRVTHSTLKVSLLVAPLYGRSTNWQEGRLLTAFCREAAPPCLCESCDADNAASGGVRLGFHCCCVMVSPVLSQFFMLLLYFFSSFAFLLMVILNRYHHSYGCLSPIYTCWYSLIPTVQTGVSQVVYQERK